MQSVPKSLDYYVLRVCERLAMEEEKFWSAGYAQQMRWLAYEQLRMQEELHATDRGDIPV